MMMLILFISTLFAALATVSKSSNISSSSTPDSFSDEAVHLDNFKYESSTVNAMNKSMHNNRLTRRYLPSFLVKLTEIPLDINSHRINSGIYGVNVKVKLGGVQQELILGIDIESKISWVKKENIQGSADANMNPYNHLDGQISGNLYPTSLTLPGDWMRFQFESDILLADVFPDMKYKQIQGALGLGYVPKKLKYPKNDDKRYPQHLFDLGFVPIFSLYFGPIGSDTSYLRVGGANPEFFHNREVITYKVPKNPGDRWQLKINYMLVNYNLIKPEYIGSGNNIAVLDTTLAGIVGPQIEVAKIYSNIRNVEILPTHRRGNHELEYSILCSEEVNFIINFSDVEYAMDPNHMKMQEISEERCLGTIAAFVGDMDPKTPGWTLGISFLRNVYTILDIQHNEIGFVSLYRATRPFFKETPGV